MIRRVHLALMKKINDYLQSGAPQGAPVRLHAVKMNDMLAKLQLQLGSARPDMPKTCVPEVTTTWGWVEPLLEEALMQIEADIETEGCMTERTAWQNQQALIAAIISGLFLPPCRVHILLTMIHPRFVGNVKCSDPDCTMKRGCLGNHLKLITVPPKLLSSWDHFDYNVTDVINVVVHHKNDR